MSYAIELIIFIVLIALFFDFVNGFHDAANSISTIVATRVLTPVKAVGLASTFNFVGIVFLPTIAATVGKGIIDPALATPVLVLGALSGAIFWDLITWWFGIPSSSSHALIGGLLGAAIAAVGLVGVISPNPVDVVRLLAWAAVGGAVGVVAMLAVCRRAKQVVTGGLVGLGALFGAMFTIPVVTFLPKFVSKAAAAAFYLPNVSGVLAVVVFIAASPLIGMATSYLICVGVMRLVRRRKTAPAKANSTFRRLQILSSAFYSFNHGTNDAQKTMGVIALLLLSGGVITKFEVPLWVALSAHAAIALGTFSGGWRIVKTMAMKITQLRPYQGFCAETGGGGVLQLMSLGGIPVSTTHAIAGSIMGVGAVHGLSAVRWGVTRRIIVAWVLTIPATALVAAVSYLALKPFLGA